jgi:hypothetical protein
LVEPKYSDTGTRLINESGVSINKAEAISDGPVKTSNAYPGVVLFAYSPVDISDQTLGGTIVYCCVVRQLSPSGIDFSELGHNLLQGG